MKAEPLSIDLLQTERGTQSRLSINQYVVSEYAELIKESEDWPFPPCDIFHDGKEFFVSDGFHRVMGAAEAGRSSVPCRVHKGTAWDALLYGMKANEKHGLRCTNADKRFRVELLLDSGKKMTQVEIAEHAGVSSRYVRSIVADRNPLSLQGKRNCSSSNTPSRGGANSGAETPSTLEDCLEVDAAPDFTHDEAPGAGNSAPSTGVGEGIKALEGRELEVFQSRAVLDQFSKTIGRWFSNPPTIDDLRAKFPGPYADSTLNSLKATFDAMKKWRKNLK